MGILFGILALMMASNIVDVAEAVPVAEAVAGSMLTPVADAVAVGSAAAVLPVGDAMTNTLAVPAAEAVAETRFV